MLTAIWHMLQTGELYSDPGGDYFRRRYPTARSNASSPSSKDSASTSRCSSPQLDPNGLSHQYRAGK